MVSPTLGQLAPGLWTAEGQADAEIPKFLKKYDFSTRMTVIGLANGGLFLHSPVRLTDGLRAELDEIGTVRAIVAPNRAHHLFVGDYASAYPDARLYGALGLQNKRKDLVFFGLLGNEARPEWRGEIEQRMVRGAPMLNEVVFFHPATRTLVLTDLVFNVPDGGVWGVPIVCKLMGASGHFGPHRFVRWAIRNKVAARQSLGFVMRWDFDRIIMAHGDIVENGGKEMLRDAFSFLLGAASRTS